MSWPVQPPPRDAERDDNGCDLRDRVSIEGERRPHAGSCPPCNRGRPRRKFTPRGAPVRMVDAQASMGEVEYVEWGCALIWRGSRGVYLIRLRGSKSAAS
jgi:hypothetical protein